MGRDLDGRPAIAAAQRATILVVVIHEQRDRKPIQTLIDLRLCLSWFAEKCDNLASVGWGKALKLGTSVDDRLTQREGSPTFFLLKKTLA